MSSSVTGKGRRHSCRFAGVVGPEGDWGHGNYAVALGIGLADALAPVAAP